MDKPTARIIAVADKGGVAGARGAGHHLTEEATKEQGVRQPCSYRSVCDISVLIFHIMYQSGEEIQPNCSNSFRTLSGISDKSPFPNLKRTYTLASAGQLVAVVPLKIPEVYLRLAVHQNGFWVTRRKVCYPQQQGVPHLLPKGILLYVEQYEEFPRPQPQQEEHILPQKR